ncbi:phage antirepressor KilAC domain-containing protein [Romboutsia hominis]|uniref:phage antirepressor KilAC domain-containing protein n=1 Tax=Romboutsia hominis TaxID=1507512 RepID=UPI001F05379B|nr:phage antirepressor KilAC domain-containing protein [Romboutsia hominis]MCH1959847.1 phage antirepressor KilAC domain-containing protein [Romboutsia hominis]MCH1969730.1 phage antirepressor KilAC domain-containing protein [Romboutsia hominis]
MFDLKVFKSSEYGEISVVFENNKEYFEATKVAQILGYTNPRKAIRDHCDKDMGTIYRAKVITGKNKDGSLKTKNINKKFIDESNLYRLVLKSKLPSAKKFEKWVVEEILPSIRRNGTYMDDETIDEILKNPEFLLKLAQKLKGEKEKVRELNKAIKDFEPYIKIGQVVGECEDAISIGAFAKMLNSLGIDIGRNRLFYWLRLNGYIMNQGNENQPKQKYVEQGLFKTRQYVVNTNNGQKIKVTTYITGKGQKYFIKIIGEEFGYEKNYRLH